MWANMWGSCHKSLLSKTMYVLISGFLADLSVSERDFTPSDIFTSLSIGKPPPGLGLNWSHKVQKLDTSFYNCDGTATTTLVLKTDLLRLV